MKKQRPMVVLAVAVTALCLTAAFPSKLPAAEWEHEWDEGYHLEEWCDPSDWFDNDAGVDYESEWYDDTYDYDWYDDDLYDCDYYTDAWFEDDFAWYGYADDVQYGDIAGTDVQQIEGTVREMKDFQLGGLEQRNMLAKIETRTGRTVRVDLGNVDEAMQMRIEKGDRVQVTGTEGSINDRPVFVAFSVQTVEGGKTLLKRSFDRNPKRLDARVLKVRSVRYQRRDVPEQVFARVQLKKGPTTMINLGSKEDLPQDLDLEGKEFSFLARPVTIAGRSALVAEEIRFDGRTIQVDFAPLPAPTGTGQGGGDTEAAPEGRQETPGRTGQRQAS